MYDKGSENLTPPSILGSIWEEFDPKFASQDRKDQQSILTGKIWVKFFPNASQMLPKCFPKMPGGDDEIFTSLVNIHSLLMSTNLYKLSQYDRAFLSEGTGEVLRRTIYLCSL